MAYGPLPSLPSNREGTTTQIRCRPLPPTDLFPQRGHCSEGHVRVCVCGCCRIDYIYKEGRRCCGDDILLDFTSHSTKSAKVSAPRGVRGRKKGVFFSSGGHTSTYSETFFGAVSPLMRWHYREHRFLTDPLGYSLALLSLSLSLSL